MHTHLPIYQVHSSGVWPVVAKVASDGIDDYLVAALPLVEFAFDPAAPPPLVQMFDLEIYAHVKENNQSFSPAVSVAVELLQELIDTVIPQLGKNVRQHHPSLQYVLQPTSQRPAALADLRTFLTVAMPFGTVLDTSMATALSLFQPKALSHIATEKAGVFV